MSELISELWRSYRENSSNESYSYVEGGQGELSNNYVNTYSTQYQGVSSSFRSDRLIKSGEGRYSSNYGRNDSIDL